MVDRAISARGRQHDGLVFDFQWSDEENTAAAGEHRRLEADYPEGTVVLALQGAMDDYSYAWGRSAEALLDLREASSSMPDAPHLDIRFDEPRGRVQVHVDSVADIERLLLAQGLALRVRLPLPREEGDGVEGGEGAVDSDGDAEGDGGFAWVSSWARWPERAAYRVLLGNLRQARCGYRISPNRAEIAAARAVLETQSARLAVVALGDAIAGDDFDFAAAALDNLLQVTSPGRCDATLAARAMAVVATALGRRGSGKAARAMSGELAARVQETARLMHAMRDRDLDEEPWSSHEAAAMHRLRQDIAAFAERREERPLTLFPAA